MIYLLWTILNVGLLIFFLVICFKATKLLREKIGGFVAVFFVLGLLSFVSNPKDKKLNSHKYETWTLNSGENLTKKGYAQGIVLEDMLISKNTLSIFYVKKNQANIPISAYSNSSGFANGTIWTSSAIIVNPTKDNRLAYSVSGVLEWKLMGATLYTQPKSYRGVFMPKEI